MSNVFTRQQKLKGAQVDTPESPYQTLYGLRENPFPSLALFTSSDTDPRQNGTIYDPEFRAQEEKLFFERFVLPPTGDRPLRLGFIRLEPQAGGRGNGKSTFLHRIMLRINKRDWRGWSQDAENPKLYGFAVHLLPGPRKHGNFFELIRLLFETIARESEFLHLGRSLDREVRAALLLDLLSEEQIAMLASDKEVDQDLEGTARFEALLERNGVGLNQFQDNAAARLQAIWPSALDNAFIQEFLDQGVSFQGAWKEWERTGKASSDYHWKRSGAQWLVNGLVPVLVLAGYQRLYVLLDEFEKIYTYQTSRKREEFLDSLRQVFYEQDSAAVRRQYVTTLLSIHPSIDTFLASHWGRVGLEQFAPLAPDEIQRFSIELGRSNVKQLTHLLTTYMDYFRTEDDPRRGTLYPFASAAIEPAMDKARYYPRNTLRYAHLVLQSAAQQKTPAPIPRQYVEDFLEKMAPDFDDPEDSLALPVSETKLEE
jgi:hypothetical protein